MASGNTLIVFRPQDNQPPATNPATLDTRNGHPVLDFDATTEEGAVFEGVLPRNYAGGGLTVAYHYAMTSAVTGDIVLQGAFERVGDQQQDIDADGFATGLDTASTTVPGTSGLVDVVTKAFTNGAEIDSIAVGEVFRFRVTREVADAGDTASGDLELLAVEIKET
jgi:hypothetical protein